MKQEFLNFLNALMERDPEFVKENLTDNIKSFIDTIEESYVEKPALTDRGKVILKHLQAAPAKSVKARDIAEDLFISSRSVSGTMRKLVNDGFCEKIGKDPAIYVLTEKGKNFIID